MPAPVRIILVEDHPLSRMGLKMSLSSQPERFQVVAEAGSAAEFHYLMDRGIQADVLVLDIILPDGTGIDIARKLRAEGHPIHILVLSAENDEQTILQLLEIGIDGFVSKMIDPRELMTAIEFVADGAEYYGKDISKLIRDIHTSRKDRSDSAFTEREREIITLCSEGLSAKEIAAKLFISTDTVNAHKYNIFKKLGISNSVELVRYALRNGIIRL